jgi:SulP family sulfate permease
MNIMRGDKLLPNLYSIKGLSREDLLNDVVAGVVLALMIIPQAMSYALLAGLPPIYGLYASTVPVFLAFLAGSSRYMQTGPVAMVSFMTLIALGSTYEAGTEEFIEHAHLLALIVGIELLVLATVIKALRIKYLLNLISHDIILGFTNAGAIIIVVTQLKHVLGVDIGHHDVVLGTIAELVRKLASLNPTALAIGLLTISIILGGRRVHRLFPGALVAVIASAFLVKELALEGRIMVVGELPRGLPGVFLPSLEVSTFTEMLLPASTIVIVGLMEALAIGNYLAKAAREKYDPVKELYGQGIANISAGFMSAYPVFGSFSRSSLNYFVLKGKSIIVPATVSLMVLLALFFTDLLHYVPLSALGGIIIVALMPLIRPRDLIRLYYSNRNDGIVALTVFTLAFLTRIDTALLIGIAVSLVLFFMETVRPRVYEISRDVTTKTFIENGGNVCPQITIVGIDNDIYFANAGEVFETIRELLKRKPRTRVLIISGESINYIDVPGEEAFLEFIEELRGMDVEVILVEFKERILEQTYIQEMVEKIGRERVFNHKNEAIGMAMELVDKQLCSGCPGIFEECCAARGGG